MIDVDWTWLAQINLFQIAVVIVALYVIARLLMRFWPWLRKVMDLTAALAQLPKFMTDTTATLAAQDTKIDVVHHELSYNNETSVKDALRRVELGVKGLYDRADAADLSDAEIREELERTQPKPFKNSHKE